MFASKYRIVEKIRSGSYGTVYKCVALKKKNEEAEGRGDEDDDGLVPSSSKAAKKLLDAEVIDGDSSNFNDQQSDSAMEVDVDDGEGDGECDGARADHKMAASTTTTGSALAAGADAPMEEDDERPSSPSHEDDFDCFRQEPHQQYYAVKVIDRAQLLHKKKESRKRRRVVGPTNSTTPTSNQVSASTSGVRDEQLHDDAENDEQELLRPFLREVQVMRELVGVPHVVQLVDHYTDHPQHLHLVMTLATGGDLFQKLATQTTYHESQARNVVRILLETLQHLHSRNVVHRDIKPENLLLLNRHDDSAILLADFGFARKVGKLRSVAAGTDTTSGSDDNANDVDDNDDDDDDGLCHTLCGTPAFAAPELLSGRPYGVSCDIWSAGCVAYLLLSGRFPFYSTPNASRNHREMFRKIRAGDYVFHQRFFASVSISAKRLVSNLLTVNVKHRYTAPQALDESDWFRHDGSDTASGRHHHHDQHDLSSSLIGIRKFQADRRWRSATGALRWASTAPFWNSDKVSFSLQLADWDRQFLQLQGVTAGTTTTTTTTSQEGPTPPPRSLLQQSAPNPGRVTESMLAKLPTLRFDDVYRRVQRIRDTGRRHAGGGGGGSSGGSASSSSVSWWECHHIAPPHERFDVKIVDRALLHPSDDEAVLNEVAILQSLSHSRHVVQLLDFYEEDDAFYLVLERVEGGDVFDQIVKRQVYTEEDARDLMLRLLRAVKDLHDVSVCHRDLKPQNLVFLTIEDANGNTKLKLTDFAFARRVHVPQSLTSRVGSPTYVAPEILKNIPHDERVDMWSVGVIAYVLLCGYPPFMEDHQALLFDQIRTGSYTFFEPHWKDVSKEAKSFVQGLLRVDPMDRWTVDEALKSRWMQVPSWRLSSNQLGDSLRNLKEKRVTLRLLARAFLWTGGVGVGGGRSSSTTATASTQRGGDDDMDEEADDARRTSASSCVAAAASEVANDLKEALVLTHDKLVASAQEKAGAVLQAVSGVHDAAQSALAKVVIPTTAAAVSGGGLPPASSQRPSPS